MRRRASMGVLFALLALAGIGFAWRRSAELHSHTGRWTVAKAEHHIRTELPPQADRGQIKDWGNRHGFHLTFSTNTEGWGVGDQSVRQIVGLKAEDLSGMMFDVIHPPNADVDWIFSGEIHLVFFLDKQGCLAGQWIRAQTHEL